MAGSPYIVTQGIVLRETQTKESDKILTLLTPERGKLFCHCTGSAAEKLPLCRLRPGAGVVGMDTVSPGRLVLRQ